MLNTCNSIKKTLNAILIILFSNYDWNKQIIGQNALNKDEKLYILFLTNRKKKNDVSSISVSDSYKTWKWISTILFRPTGELGHSANFYP